LDDKALLPCFQCFFPDTHLLVGAPSYFSAGCSLLASAIVVLLSIDPVASLIRVHVNWRQPLARLFDVLEPFHLVNRYGLFAVMTTWRSEIMVEGSMEGRNWEPYEFRWKPGEVRRAPCWVAPHQPRLDWQMWFAALGSRLGNPWFDSFCDRLTQ